MWLWDSCFDGIVLIVLDELINLVVGSMYWLDIIGIDLCLL